LKEAAETGRFFFARLSSLVDEDPCICMWSRKRAVPEHSMVVQPVILLKGKTALSLQLFQTFQRTVFFRGYKKTIRFYASIRYYQLHRVVQQELKHVKGEDLCVY
jgi:hypothetical protein